MAPHSIDIDYASMEAMMATGKSARTAFSSLVALCTGPYRWISNVYISDVRLVRREVLGTCEICERPVTDDDSRIGQMLLGQQLWTHTACENRAAAERQEREDAFPL